MKSTFQLIGTFLFAFIFSMCTETTPPNLASSNKNEPNGTASTSTETRKNIIFFGNSLTAGFGLDDVKDGFVALTQNRIDSLKQNYHCINAGLSGETTAGGVDRLNWVIASQPFDIFILELGGNDALRGISPESSAKNLQAIIDKVRIKNPAAKIILAGMEAPRNMGKTYDVAFHGIYPTIAQKNKIPLVPFILENVGGVASLNQNDGIHPNIAGNKIVVENIWNVLKNQF